jgi:hypothetical protein
MLELIAALEPGQHSRIGVRRDGREIEVDAVIGKRPKPQGD